MEKRVISFEQLKADAEGNLVKDGHITPILVICTEETAFLVDATEAVKDIDRMVQWTARVAREKKAYKVFFVSEVWKHEVDAEDTEKVVNSTEAYQVVEVQQDRVNLFLRDFVKDNDAVLFTKGNGVLTTPEPNIFAQIQMSLDYLQ